jgi:hypothetical protein
MNAPCRSVDPEQQAEITSEGKVSIWSFSQGVAAKAGRLPKDGAGNHAFTLTTRTTEREIKNVCQI